MNILKKIKKLLKEAELYHSQGLLYEAIAKYNDATEIIQNIEKLKNKQSLLEGISKKINMVKQDISKAELAPKRPEVSENIQDLIKKMYSFSPDIDEDAKALEGAVALAKFGQFKRAILEFNELLKRDSTRIDAAKNILRCHMALYSVDEAISQYEKWLFDDIFQLNQLDKIYIFFENLLKSEGVKQTLPKTKEEVDELRLKASQKKDQVQVLEPEDTGLEKDEPEPEVESEAESEVEAEVEAESEAGDEDVLDVNSIGISLDSGPQKGDVYEFKVRFQLGKVVSLLIPSRDKDVIENFQVGSELHDVQYYSNVGLFKGSGLVSAVKEITIGPLRGDYCVDIEVVVH
jgi:tetratricopeptide (TPR) repeat protein